MSSSGSHSSLFVKTQLDPKLSVSIVQKPPNADGICPDNVPKKCLPHIKPLGSGEKKKLCSFEPVKPNVTLPKLKPKKVLQQRVEAGEPFNRFLPDYYYNQPSESVLTDKESEVFEPLSWDHESTSLSLIGEADPDNQVLTEAKANALRAKLEEMMKAVNKPRKPKGCHALERWEFWIKDKKRVQNYLSQKIGRKAQDLMLQESDKYREVLQRKLFHQYCQTNKPSRWSVSPARWKPTLNITSKKNLQENEYCLMKTNVEPDEIPAMEYIRIPDQIKKEKGLVAEVESYDRRNSLRFQSRRKKYKSNADFNKDLDHLAIIGTQMLHASESIESSVASSNLPQIIITSPQKDNAEENGPEGRKSVFCLVIEGEEVKNEIRTDCTEDPNRKFTWQVNFGVNTAGSIVEKVLRVENRGTMAVKYEWFSPKYEQKLSLNLLQPKRREPWFYFNKNSGILLPGQIYDIKIYLQAKTSGIRKETWFLKTTPTLSATQKYATIIISAVATEEFFGKPKALETYLEKRVKESIASFLFDIILQKVFRVSEDILGVEYPSIFHKKELFEFHNRKYYYHSVIVNELYEFFNEIPMKTQTEWDYSLDSLIYLTKTFKVGREKNDCLVEIAKKARQLFKPNYVYAKTVKKYKMTYDILCKMTNFMDQDYEFLRKSVSEKIEPSSKSVSKFAESKESLVSSNIFGGDTGEFDSDMLFIEIKPINYVFFQTMFYLKVYCRVCEAVESIAGVLETEKLFKMNKPWENFNHILKKPTKRL